MLVSVLVIDLSLPSTGGVMISHTGELTLTLRRSTQSKHVRLEKLIHPVWVTVLSMITLYPRHLHHILFNTTASVAVNSRSSTIWDGTGLIYAVSFMGRSFWLLLETLARVCAVNPLKVSNAHLASVVVIFQTAPSSHRWHNPISTCTCRYKKKGLGVHGQATDYVFTALQLQSKEVR